jgi:hypothetical protein
MHLYKRICNAHVTPYFVSQPQPLEDNRKWVHVIGIQTTYNLMVGLSLKFKTSALRAIERPLIRFLSSLYGFL